MIEWTVRVDGASEVVTENLAEGLIETLAGYAPAASYGHGQIAATLSVRAATPRQAPDKTLAAFGAAAAVIEVSHVEADRAAEGDEAEWVVLKDYPKL